MSVGEILGYIVQLATDFGVVPFIAAGLIVTVTVGTFVAVRRLMMGS